MKKESQKFLETSLNSFVYQGVKSLFDLFKLYSGLEIYSFDDIDYSVNEFCKFMTENSYRIKRKELTDEAGFVRGVSSFYRSFNSLMGRYNSRIYQTFAKMVVSVSPVDDGSKVLEVGSGVIPSSSIFLAGELGEVNSIDKEFVFSDKCLKNMKVNSDEVIFDQFTNINRYSFIVGRCPCSAIRPIVKKCANLNKAYFLKLCDCDLSNRSGWFIDDGGADWETILHALDPNVCIHRGYAFNFDATKNVSKIIDRYDKLSDIKFCSPRIKNRYINSENLVVDEIEKE